MNMIVYRKPNGEVYVAPQSEGTSDKPVKVVPVDTSSDLDAANASVETALSGYVCEGYYPRLRVLSVSPFRWCAVVSKGEPPADWWVEGEVP